MARSKDSFNSKDREKAKLKKRKDKEQKKEQRKANSGKGKGLENMFAYVDAFGNLLSSPPDPGQKQYVNPEDIIISIARKVDSEPDDQRHTGDHQVRDHAVGNAGHKGLRKEGDSHRSVHLTFLLYLSA